MAIPASPAPSNRSEAGSGTEVGAAETRKNDSPPPVAPFHTALNTTFVPLPKEERSTVDRVKSPKPLPAFASGDPIRDGPVNVNSGTPPTVTVKLCNVSPACAVFTSIAMLKLLLPTAVVSCPTVYVGLVSL